MGQDIAHTHRPEMATSHKSEGKLDLSMVPPDIIVAIASVLQQASSPDADGNPPKYDRFNWFNYRDADHQDFANSAYRHLLAYLSGETRDHATGQHPLAHVVTDLMFLLVWIRRGHGVNITPPFAMEPDDAGNVMPWNELPWGPNFER